AGASGPPPVPPRSVRAAEAAAGDAAGGHSPRSGRSRLAGDPYGGPRETLTDHLGPRGRRRARAARPARALPADGVRRDALPPAVRAGLRRVRRRAVPGGPALSGLSAGQRDPVRGGDA